MLLWEFSALLFFIAWSFRNPNLLKSTMRMHTPSIIERSRAKLTVLSWLRQEAIYLPPFKSRLDSTPLTWQRTWLCFHSSSSSSSLLPFVYVQCALCEKGRKNQLKYAFHSFSLVISGGQWVSFRTFFSHFSILLASRNYGTNKADSAKMMFARSDTRKKEKKILIKFPISNVVESNSKYDCLSPNL